MEFAGPADPVSRLVSRSGQLVWRRGEVLAMTRAWSAGVHQEFNEDGKTPVIVDRVEKVVSDNVHYFNGRPFRAGSAIGVRLLLLSH